MFGTRDARSGSEAFPSLTFLSSQGTTLHFGPEGQRRPLPARPGPGGARRGFQLPRAGPDPPPQPGDTGRPQRPALTCRKQKGTVSTLTPTMLFTTFMIRPQLEPAAAAAAMARGGGSPRRDTRCVAAPRAPRPARSARCHRSLSAGRARHGPTGHAPTRHRPQRHFRLPPPPQEVTYPRGAAPAAPEVWTRWWWRTKGGPRGWGHPRRAERGRGDAGMYQDTYPCGSVREKARRGACACLYTCVCTYTHEHTAGSSADTRAGVPGLMAASERPLEGRTSPSASPPPAHLGMHPAVRTHLLPIPPAAIPGSTPPHPTGEGKKKKRCGGGILYLLGGLWKGPPRPGWRQPRVALAKGTFPSERNEAQCSYNLQQLRWETAGIRSPEGLQGGERAA